MNKCPVPIRVTRVKTNYLHTEYLEHDAIVAIQKYLNCRYQSYVRTCRAKKIDEGYILEKNQMMQNGKPMFVTRENTPISINWVSRLVPRLALKAGIQKIIKGSQLQNKSEEIGHELRNLLKSTLIVSGTADYVCQLAISHTVGDSYEKQDKLYPELSREEYAKASSRINIFTNASNFINHGDESEKLKDQIAILQSKMKSEIKDTIVEERKHIIEMFKQTVSKQYDDQAKQNNKDVLIAEKESKHVNKIIKNNADELELKKEELMNNIMDKVKASGKSYRDVMADLIKLSSIKPKQSS